MQPESDGSRSGSSLSLRDIQPGGTGSGGGVTATTNNAQSPPHRGVHRSISATNSKPSRRASSGGETNGGETNNSCLALYSVARTAIFSINNTHTSFWVCSLAF